MFPTVVLEKTLESPLNCKEIELVHAKGFRQVWFGKTIVFHIIYGFRKGRGIRDQIATLVGS